MVGSREMEASETPFFPKVFFHNQFRAKPILPPKSTNLSGKTAIITGGNAGLGLEAGDQLLGLKLSRLILAVRSEKRGEVAAASLNDKYPDAIIDVWLLDMAVYDSIVAFAKRAEAELDRLDIVILNAGVRKLVFDKNKATGHEESIQINYLSTVLLTVLMMPILKEKSPKGVPGRLTIVGAALALAAKFTNKEEDPLLPSFDDPKYFDPIDRYNTSKVLGHIFLWKLVDYVSAKDVIVNIADPGFVKGTDLTREAKGGQKIAASLFGSLVGRTVKEGASTYIDAAVIKGPDSHGGFIMSWKVHPFAPLLYTIEGKTIRERLWEETLTELHFAGISNVLEAMKGS